MLKNLALTSLVAISCVSSVAPLFAKDATNKDQAHVVINTDPYVDELMTNGVECQSPFWQEVKERLTQGDVDQALKLCRKVLARRELDIDMHCIYAMALEMKYRQSEHDSALFDECVKEWTHVSKYKVLADSNGWDHVGDGEVFSQNTERKQMANRHLEALVGRAPKYFESEKSFLAKSIKVNTEVAGKLKPPSKDTF